MKEKAAYSLRWLTVIVLLGTMIMMTLLNSAPVFAANITTAGSGNWNSTTPNAPWPGGTVPAATDNVIIAAGNTVTVTAAASITNLTLSATTSKLVINSGQTIIVSGTFSNSGTTTNGVNGPGTILFTGTTSFGSLTPTGTRPNVTAGNGSSTNTVTIGANTLIADLTVNANAALTDTTFTVGISGNLSVSGTFTAGSGAYTFSGTAKTISGTSAIAIPSLTISGTTTNNGNLTVSTTLAGASTLTNGANATLNFGGASITPTLTATASGNTVNYSRANTQTVKATTYYNLTLSGTSAKTTTSVTVNGILSMEGTATASAAPTYGTSATLQYNTATSRTAGAEWIATFSATSGVIIANNGMITLNNAKVFNTSVPLTINSGATLATNNYSLTFGGNFVNNGGTFTAGSSNITITGGVNQNIAGFTTGGDIIGTKSGNDQVIAAFTSAVSGKNLNLNSPNNPGGRIQLCDGTVNIFSGTWTQGFTILGGGNSTLRISGTSTANQFGYFYQGTSTVEFIAAGAQTIACVEYYNLKLSGGGLKTMQNIGGQVPTIGTQDGGTLSMEGNATVNVAPVYRDKGTLQYNTATSRTAGPEWITPFVSTQWNGGTSGGVIIANTGTITLNGAKVINAGVPLTINSGATLNVSGFTLAAGGDVSNSGTHIGTGKISLTGGSASHTLSGSGTYGNLQMNDSYGASLSGSPTINGTLTLTSGNITTNTNTLIISSNGSVSGGSSSSYVIGNLQKNVATGATSRTFEVGTVSAYDPVTVAFGSVTTAGNLTATVTSGQHPNIGTSTINSSKDVNEYWSLTNSGVVFNSYNATFTFVTGDILGGANPTNFIVGNYNSSSWTYPTVGTKTATSTQATGLTSFGDFAIGEVAIVIVVPTIDITAPSNISSWALVIGNNSTTGTLAINVSPSSTSWYVTAQDTDTVNTNGRMTLWEGSSYNTSVKLTYAMNVSGNFGEVTLPIGGNISTGTGNYSGAVTFKQEVTWDDDPGIYRIVVTFIGTVN